MLRHIIFNSFKTDIKFIARAPMLLLISLAPVILILLLRFAFPLISDFILSKTGFLLDNYYTIIAITISSVFPLLFGLVYVFVLLNENDMHIPQVVAVTPAGKKNTLYMRMITPAFLTFLLVLISIIVTNPVPTEGWLRTTFICFLMSIQAPFVFLFIGSLAGNKAEGKSFSKLFVIFIIAVPVGLILHHPWNYLAFFSPLYWIGWSWITPVPAESLIYGAISIIITFGCIMIFFSHYLKKHTN